MNKFATIAVSMIAAVAIVSTAANARGPARPRAGAPTKCAGPDDFAILQISAIQQEFTDAALVCGDAVRNQYNEYQTKFGPAITLSERQLLAVFRRFLGARGATATEQFKTSLGSKAEFRRIRDHAGFCAGVAKKLETVLSLSVPGTSKKDAARNFDALKTFDSNEATVDFVWPIKACEIVIPDVLPLPNPLRTAEREPETSK